MSLQENDLPGAVLFDKDRTLLYPFPPDREWRKIGYSRRRNFKPNTEGEVLTVEGNSYWYEKSLLRGGTLALLRLLKAEGVHCGILTLDLEEAVSELLEKAALRDFFHSNGIVAADNIDRQHHKPNSGHFLFAAEKLGVRPEDCIMIGDDLEADIAGAKAVGMRTVLVRYWRYSKEDRKLVKPDLVVRDFNELGLDQLGQLYVKS